MAKNKDESMAKTYGSHMEKVTFNMPVELKEKVMVLKNELNVSLSTIYNDAIADYIKKKESEKWKKGVDMALGDKDYRHLAEEIGSDNGDIYEY